MTKCVFLSIFFAYAISQQCGKNATSQKCPQWAPCCSKGKCSSHISDCTNYCDKGYSYSKESCSDKYYCKSLKEDFNNFKIFNSVNFSGDPLVSEFYSKHSPDNVVVENGKMVLELKLTNKKLNENKKLQGSGSTIESTRYMQYGKVRAKIKTGSTDSGVISSFITMSPEGDEIDYEWVGKTPNESQTNFYYNGVLDYTKGKPHTSTFDTSQDYHVYEIDWQPEYIRWTIDDVLIREVNKKDTYNLTSKSYDFPTRPSQIGLGLWDGGSGPDGTSAWAGSSNWDDENKAHKMYVDWIEVECHYSGNDTHYKTPSNKPSIEKAKSDSALKQLPLALYLSSLILAIVYSW